MMLSFSKQFCLKGDKVSWKIPHPVEPVGFKVDCFTLSRMSKGAEIRGVLDLRWVTTSNLLSQTTSFRPTVQRKVRRMNQPRHKRFATTQWSIVRAAAHDSCGTARTALEELCHIYWFPVYAFVRRKGHSPADAEDLTQGFFVHLLESAFVKSADRDRGRFRSFLLKSVSNFLNVDHRSRTAEKRGGGQSVLSLDFESGEHQYAQVAADSASADQLFERRWAMTLLQNTAALLRSEYEQRNHGQLYELLEPHLNQDAARVPYVDLIPQLSMSEDAIKQAARRMKLRYREILRAEIASTVGSAGEVDDELRQLMKILS